MWAILPIRERRCQDIDQVLLHEIIFFFLSVFSSSEVLSKITSIRNKLPTAACWSRKKKGGNCEANLVYVKSDFSTTDTTEKSFTVFFARWGVKFDCRVKISARWVKINNSTIELHVLSRRKKTLQSNCSVDFDFLALMRFDMTFHVTLRDNSSFGKLTNSCNFTFTGNV